MTTPDHEGEAPLAAAVRASGDPELLPSAVIELHGSGHALGARQQLLRQIRWERDQTRAAKQRALAKDLRLWLEPVQHPPEMLTFYGIGTRLYGSHQAAQNGSHIATLWFVILYLPIWPIASYLVVDAPSGGWYFLARSPLPPVARTARRVFPWVIGALLAVLSWIPYQAGRRTDILVFNGFDRPVIADVGDQQVTVPPRADGAVRNLPLVVTRLRARWAGEDESFDSLAVDLSGHGRHRVIYNVAGRGVLELGYIVYGPGPDKEGRLLEAGPDRPRREDRLRVHRPARLQARLEGLVDQKFGAARR